MAPTSRKRKAAAQGASSSKSNSRTNESSRRIKQTRTTKKEAHDSINTIPTEKVSVFVFGGGENGELGLGPKCTAASRPRKSLYLDPFDSSKYHITRVACGGMHTVALTDDNQIITWGVNDNDALGRTTHWDGGLRDEDAESDDDDGELNPFESTPTAINTKFFASGAKFVDVAAGDSCSFALTDDGLVYGWGTFRDPEGKEGFGYSPNGVKIIKQATPMLIPDLTNVTQLACGANHVLALDTRGNIWGWGSGHQNQFGHRLFGRHQDSLKPQQVRVCRGTAKYIACGEYHCFAVDKKDNVWGWGLNSFGEAGDVKTAGSDDAILPHAVKIPTLCGQRVFLLTGGAHHSVAVTLDGRCFTWGRLDGGQLGLDLTATQLADEDRVRCDERGKPRICLLPTEVPNLGGIALAACGTDHTLFVTKTGQVLSTGFGSEGQLGLGSDDDVNVPVIIDGKQIKGQHVIWAGAGGQFSVVSARITTS